VEEDRGEMSVSAKDVKTLREMTGAGMLDCKKALEETGGDMSAAVDWLRTKGAAKAAKRAEKSANQGTIGYYLHHGGRIGVLVEVNCETDFVANTDEFQALARDIAMHIAASNPLSVSEADVPADVVAHERQIYTEQVKAEGKPEKIREKIVEGKLRRFFEESTLLLQPFVKNPDRTVGEDLVTELSAKTGEKVEVGRFTRFEVGRAS
jgi:elongation factor Ts